MIWEKYLSDPSFFTFLILEHLQLGVGMITYPFIILKKQVQTSLTYYSFIVIPLEPKTENSTNQNTMGRVNLKKLPDEKRDTPTSKKRRTEDIHQGKKTTGNNRETNKDIAKRYFIKCYILLIFDYFHSIEKVSKTKQKKGPFKNKRQQ